MIDEDLKDEAAHALVNAFYLDFSKLVNAYLLAGKGLEDCDLEQRLSDTANVYSRKDGVLPQPGDELGPTIWASSDTESRDYTTLLEALSSPFGICIYMTGISLQPALERDEEGGEWRESHAD
jgi:hypothetical protein